MENLSASQHAQQALACVRANDSAGAIAHYRLAIEIDNSQPASVYAGLGHQLLKCNKVDEAEQVFLIASEKYPNAHNGFTGLAVVAQYREQWEVAVERWSGCLESFPQQTQAWWSTGKANALMHLGRFEEAESIFQRLSATLPDQPAGRVGLARLAQCQQRWEVALERWNRCLAEFPQHALWWWRSAKGQTLLHLRQPEAAQEIFQQLQIDQPHQPDGLDGMAQAARCTGDYELSLAYCRQLIERFPKNDIGYRRAREVYEEQGRFDQARKMRHARHADSHASPHLNVNEPMKANPSNTHLNQNISIHDVVCLIVTCEKYSWKANAIRETWLKDLKAHGGRYYFLMGNPEIQKAEVIGDVLYVPCRDDYESLLLKLALAYQFIDENLSFSHVYKIDDDIYLNVEKTISDILPQLRGKKYAGGIVFPKTEKINKLHHFGKCSDDRFHKPSPIDLAPCDYAGGGTTYFLAKEIICHLTSHIDLFKSELNEHIYSYEDIRIADILNAEGIQACQLECFSQRNSLTSIIKSSDFVVAFDLADSKLYHDLHEIFTNCKLDEKHVDQAKKPILHFSQIQIGRKNKYVKSMGSTFTKLSQIFSDNPLNANYRVNYSDENRYIYVETAKVSCSTIKCTLQKIEKDDPFYLSDDIHDIRMSPLKSPLQEETEFCRKLYSDKYIKFCFVRNPFTRLVSAYLDKIVSPSDEKTRLKYLSELNLSPEKSVSLLEFLLEIRKDKAEEFNPHWRPQSILLGIDKVPYDFIGRFENFDNDFKRVIKAIGKSNEFITTYAPHATNAQDSIKNLLGQREIDLICEIYEDDFKNFLYSYNPIFC